MFVYKRCANDCRSFGMIIVKLDFFEKLEKLFFTKVFVVDIAKRRLELASQLRQVVNICI